MNVPFFAEARPHNLLMEAMNADTGIVYRYKNPLTRLDSFTVEPQYKTSTWASNLGLELGAHIAFEIQTAGLLPWNKPTPPRTCVFRSEPATLYTKPTRGANV